MQSKFPQLLYAFALLRLAQLSRKNDSNRFLIIILIPSTVAATTIAKISIIRLVFMGASCKH